jgi:hypothetical protein
MAILKVAVSIPNESFISVSAYDNHLLVANHLGKCEMIWKYDKRDPCYEFGWFTTGRLFTSFAREKLAENAIKQGYDFLLMMDNDMLYPINFVEAMLEDMEKHPEIDVLAPLAFLRNPPHYPVMYSVTEGYDGDLNQDYFINKFVKNYPRDKLVECDAVGFGAVLIKTSLLKKMKSPYFFSTSGVGEDIWFCHKAKKEANARVFMDTRIKLAHLGNNIVVDEAYRDKFIKEHGEIIEEEYNFNKYK